MNLITKTTRYKNDKRIKIVISGKKGRRVLKTLLRKKARKYFNQKEKHWDHSTAGNIYYISFNFSLSAFSEK